jgi:hypothetical protein
METLEQIMGDRWAPLKIYLEGLEVEDLINMHEDDIIDSVEPKHRLLMRAFTRHLFSVTRDKPAIPAIPAITDNSNAYFDLSGKQLSERFRCRTSMHHLISNLCNLTVHPCVQYISLRQNQLFDSDLKYVKNFLEQFTKTSTNQVTVDLSENEFDGTKPTMISAQFIYDLIQILDLEKIEYVCLCDNPFAVRLSVFQQSHPKFYQKLIWMPEQWFEPDSYWEKSLRSTYSYYDIVTIRHAHDEYYKATPKSWRRRCNP